MKCAPRSRRSAPLSLAGSLASLATLDLAQLRLQFRNHTGRVAPARISRTLLLQTLAYRMQADVHGDLRPETRRLLARIVSTGTETTKGAHDPRPDLARPAAVVTATMHQRGTVLVREWQGRMERVTVVDEGYDWNGTAYASLSAVAKAITGTKWNGRRFFGLDRPVKPGDAR